MCDSSGQLCSSSLLCFRIIFQTQRIPSINHFLNNFLMSRRRPKNSQTLFEAIEKFANFYKSFNKIFNAISSSLNFSLNREIRWIRWIIVTTIDRRQIYTSRQIQMQFGTVVGNVSWIETVAF